MNNVIHVVLHKTVETVETSVLIFTFGIEIDSAIKNQQCLTKFCRCCVTNTINYELFTNIQQEAKRSIIFMVQMDNYCVQQRVNSTAQQLNPRDAVV